MKGSKSILLVEDGHVAPPTAGTALDELGICHATMCVPNGDEALAYLQKIPPGEPSLILVDSSSGQARVLALVRAIKQDQRLRDIPVIALTGSGDAGAVNKSFDLGAVGYIVKPSDHGEFIEVLRAIHQYWTLSRVPADI